MISLSLFQLIFVSFLRNTRQSVSNGWLKIAKIFQLYHSFIQQITHQLCDLKAFNEWMKRCDYYILKNFRSFSHQESLGVSWVLSNSEHRACGRNSVSCGNGFEWIWFDGTPNICNPWAACWQTTGLIGYFCIFITNPHWICQILRAKCGFVILKIKQKKGKKYVTYLL